MLLAFDLSNPGKLTISDYGLLYIGVYSVMIIWSMLNGWLLLAWYYRARKQEMTNLSISTSTDCSINCISYFGLEVGTCDEGLYLSLMSVFSLVLLHPPLMIPWDNVTVRRESSSHYYLRLATPSSITINLSFPKEAMKRAEHIMESKMPKKTK